VIRVTDRDWPPTEQAKPPRRPVMVEVLVGFLLFPLAPLGAWFVAALPGSHPWATAIWPAGWAVAIVVLLVGNFVRERRSS
jgi:steroid 5-alpha reductase family enzyme